MTSVAEYMKEMMEEYEQDEMVTQVAADKVVDLVSESESEPEAATKTKKRKYTTDESLAPGLAWDVPSTYPADPVEATIRLSTLVRNHIRYIYDLNDDDNESSFSPEEKEIESLAVLRCCRRDMRQIQCCLNSDILPELVYKLWGKNVPGHIAEMACEITELNMTRIISDDTPNDVANTMRLLYVEFALSCKVRRQEKQMAISFKSGNINAFSYKF